MYLEEILLSDIDERSFPVSVRIVYTFDDETIELYFGDTPFNRSAAGEKVVVDVSEYVKRETHGYSDITLAQSLDDITKKVFNIINAKWSAWGEKDQKVYGDLRSLLQLLLRAD